MVITKKKNRLIPQVINNLNIKKKIIINNPNNIRNFCHIDDITNAINISIKKNIKNKIINIGFNKNYKIIDVVKKITKILKRKKNSVIISKNFNKNFESYKIIPSIKRAKLLLKWDPKINLEDGIKKTIQYIKR
jgi:nucleoside-diphosphate-sugar epimerase